jgi:hypothetical protein
MKERLIIIIVAIIAGLFITSAGFFIYQSTKKASDTPIAKTSSTKSTSPKNDGTLFVRVTEPNDESLTSKRTVNVKGSTNPENIVVISSNLEDIEVKPDQDGNFSTSIDIDAGANEIVTRAIGPDGNSAQDLKTITYSTEEF